MLCTFRDIPLLSLQTKPPFASAQCFFPTLCPPSFSPFLYAITFWRFSMEILVWFCLDLPFLMLFFERPLLWSWYCSYYRSTAKHRKHFWHSLLCILWHEETINWFFWVLDLHSSIYLLLHMFYLLGWHSSFLEDHKLDQTVGTENSTKLFHYWVQKRDVASGNGNAFIVLFYEDLMCIRSLMKKKNPPFCKLNHFSGINVIWSPLSWEKMSYVQTMKLKEQQIVTMPLGWTSLIF